MGDERPLMYRFRKTTPFVTNVTSWLACGVDNADERSNVDIRMTLSIYARISA